MNRTISGIHFSPFSLQKSEILKFNILHIHELAKLQYSLRCCFPKKAKTASTSIKICSCIGFVLCYFWHQLVFCCCLFLLPWPSLIVASSNIHIKHNHPRKQKNTPGFQTPAVNLQQIKKLIRWRERHNAHSQFQIARKKNNTSIPVDTNKRRCKSLCTNWSPILSKPLRVATRWLLSIFCFSLKRKRWK